MPPGSLPPRPWTTSTLTSNPPSDSRSPALASGAFLTEAHNLVLLGSPSTGKTHLATAWAPSPPANDTKCCSPPGLRALRAGLVRLATGVQAEGQDLPWPGETGDPRSPADSMAATSASGHTSISLAHSVTLDRLANNICGSESNRPSLALAMSTTPRSVSKEARHSIFRHFTIKLQV